MGSPSTFGTAKLAAMAVHCTTRRSEGGSLRVQSWRVRRSIAHVRAEATLGSTETPLIVFIGL
jgi:hypothetical protein